MLPGYDVPVSFAVAGDKAEMEADIQNFNGTLFTAMAGLGLGLLIALLIQVRFGLQPLERVRRALALDAPATTRLEGDFRPRSNRSPRKSTRSWKATAKCSNAPAPMSAILLMR